jgi:hypothetical protein
MDTKKKWEEVWTITQSPVQILQMLLWPINRFHSIWNQVVHRWNCIHLQVNYFHSHGCSCKVQLVAMRLLLPSYNVQSRTCDETALNSCHCLISRLLKRVKIINLVPIPNQNQKTDQADSHMLHLKDVEGRHGWTGWVMGTHREADGSFCMYVVLTLVKLGICWDCCSIPNSISC